MNKKDVFLKMVDELVGEATAAGKELNADALVYLEALKTSKEKDKPQFTDNGKLIIVFMKDTHEAVNNLFKAKDIAEGIFVSSRSVSGSIRKLVTDGYVEKIGQDPIVYSLTTLGKDSVID